MDVVKTIDKKVEDLADKAPDMAAKKIQKDVKKKLKENAWGLVCIAMFKSEENQTRCKALTKLRGIAKSGLKAGASCTAAVGVGAAEVGTAGAASPVAVPAGLIAGGSCLYNGAKFVDGLNAFGETMRTGKEVKTYESQLTAAAGTWVMKKAEDEANRQLYEAATSHYRHNKAANGADFTMADQARLDAAEQGGLGGDF